MPTVRIRCRAGLVSRVWLLRLPGNRLPAAYGFDPIVGLAPRRDGLFAKPLVLAEYRVVFEYGRGRASIFLSERTRGVQRQPDDYCPSGRP